MKKIFFFLILTNLVNAEIKIPTIAQVNETIITSVDIQNEIEVMAILFNISKETKDINIIALNSLIDEIIKEQEIKKYNISINNKLLEDKYNSILNDIDSKNIKITDLIKKNIYKKIKIDYEWNIFINNQYSWIAEINLGELESKINKTNNSKNEEIINIEKQKKLRVYSSNHFDKLKTKSFIKIY